MQRWKSCFILFNFAHVTFVYRVWSLLANRGRALSPAPVLKDALASCVVNLTCPSSGGEVWETLQVHLFLLEGQ